MTFAALRSVFLVSALAFALAACSQSEAPIPEFETVTIDYRDQGAQVASASVPLPERKPTYLASAAGREATVIAAAPSEERIVSPTPIGPNGRVVATSETEAAPQTVAAADTGSSSKYASVTRYFKRWLPDFNKITECPNGITCQAAFANN